MALAEQVFEFFIPSVTKMGIGAVKQLGSTANFLGGTKALLVTDKGMVRPWRGRSDEEAAGGGERCPR